MSEPEDDQPPAAPPLAPESEKTVFAPLPLLAAQRMDTAKAGSPDAGNEEAEPALPAEPDIGAQGAEDAQATDMSRPELAAEPGETVPEPAGDPDRVVPTEAPDEADPFADLDLSGLVEAADAGQPESPADPFAALGDDMFGARPDEAEAEAEAEPETGAADEPALPLAPALQPVTAEGELPANIAPQDQKQKYAAGADPLLGAASDYGYLALLRVLERRARDRPRFGRSRRTREDLARLGQDPFLAFPDSDLSEVEIDGDRPRIRARFMGFFGPHGALPLNTTEEVLQWFNQGDAAFVEFTDIFAARFLQLFYRAWADAHRITQFDHPGDDRFQKYLLSMTGLGTPAFRNQSPDGDTTRLAYVALAQGRVKSPARLRQMLSSQLRMKVTVEEMVPSWMEFEDDALSRVGQQGSTLGRDMHLGSRIKSIGEKLRIHVHVDTLQDYYRLLPGGADHRLIRTMVLGYIGQSFEVDVSLWLPPDAVEPARLGATAQLGWMACMAPRAEGSEPVLGTNYRLDLSPPVATTDQGRAAA